MDASEVISALVSTGQQAWAEAVTASPGNNGHVRAASDSGSTHGASPHPRLVLMRRHPKPDLHGTGSPRHGVADKQLLHPVLPDDPRADAHGLADRRHTGVGELLGSQGTRPPRDPPRHVSHSRRVSNKRTSHRRRAPPWPGSARGVHCHRLRGSDVVYRVSPRCRSTTHHNDQADANPSDQSEPPVPVIARSLMNLPRAGRRQEDRSLHRPREHSCVRPSRKALKAAQFYPNFYRTSRHKATRPGPCRHAFATPLGL